ncbi:glycerol dehydrogenase [Bifidobacterium sp. MA2]|uniref:Glycerol dehydrogenase n=1 Tax=Bifidobacterium santillanense TaxID=2809028 RepID=A0ABS5UMA8_9BIFI|nr:glycerol dehydrogenase [Bifidobacterium santillanense]MBT1172019.1 glycerol dehydrogenase [Bifidobacterium santillanense]
MRKVLCSPGSYIQEADALTALADEYRELGSTGAYLIVDPFIDSMYRDLIVSGFEKTGTPYHYEVFNRECSMTEVDRHRGLLADNDAVIGVGGGKTLDTSKAVAHFAGLPVVIAPTAASSDAPCSRLSVLYTDDRQFDRYLPLPKNPDKVIMDTTIIAKAPARFLTAGFGDAYATWFEAAACIRSNAVTMTGGHATNAAEAMARLCHDLLIADGVKALAAARRGFVTPALEQVIEANTLLSGIGFESSGLAAAHAIHNGLTVLEGTHRYLHGEKVAYGTLAQFVLEDRPMADFEEAYGFFRAVGLPTTLAGIGIADAADDDLLRVGELACAPDDTMGNMPFEVTPADVAAALRAVDELDAVVG